MWEAEKRGNVVQNACNQADATKAALSAVNVKITRDRPGRSTFVAHNVTRNA